MECRIVVAWGWGPEGQLQRGMREYFREMEIFYILIEVIVT